MKINYSINHLLLQAPCFGEELTPTEHQALLITFSYVVHWCTYNGGVCHFKQGALHRDWRIKQHFFSRAIKLLIKYKYIKQIKSHSQRDQSSAIYSLDRGCTPFVKKLYPKESKAVPQGGTVNNINNIIKGDDVKTSPPLKNATQSDTIETQVWKNLKQ